MQQTATLHHWQRPGPHPATDPGADLCEQLAVWDAVLGSGPQADVIDLEQQRARRRPVSRAVHLRRRSGLILAVLGLAMTLVLLVGAVGATADLQRPAVSGQVVLEPGATLWEVAATHAPDGVDPRTYLGAIVDVNGFTSGDVPAWTVVLLPAAP